MHRVVLRCRGFPLCHYGVGFPPLPCRPCAPSWHSLVPPTPFLGTLAPPYPLLQYLFSLLLAPPFSPLIQTNILRVWGASGVTPLMAWLLYAVVAVVANWLFIFTHFFSSGLRKGSIISEPCKEGRWTPLFQEKIRWYELKRICFIYIFSLFYSKFRQSRLRDSLVCI